MTEQRWTNEQIRKLLVMFVEDATAPYPFLADSDVDPRYEAALGKIAEIAAEALYPTEEDVEK